MGFTSGLLKLPGLISRYKSISFYMHKTQVPEIISRFSDKKKTCKKGPNFLYALSRTTNFVCLGMRKGTKKSLVIVMLSVSSKLLFARNLSFMDSKLHELLEDINLFPYTLFSFLKN